MMATSRILILLVVSCPLLVVACAVRRARVHDYIFDVTGLVTADDGSPIQGAEVTLEVKGPVYEALTLVKTVKASTNSAGGFIFMYISHERGVEYSLIVRKEGFEPQTASGSAPPDGHHTFRIKRAGK